MSVALVSKHPMRMRRVVICGLSGYTIFFTHRLIKCKLFEKKVIDRKMCVFIFSTSSV